MDKWLHILRFRWEEHLRGGMCNLEKKCGGMCSQKKTHEKSISGGMCSQNCEFLDPCITAVECNANILIFLTHAIQCSSQKFQFLDPCMTAEKCVAKNANFWTHALKQRNV